MDAQGFLFSALTLETSPLYLWWDSLLPQLKTQFPGLKFKTPAELHITLVYVGRWQPADLTVLKSACSVTPRDDQNLAGHLRYFGVGERVLGLDLTGYTSAWGAAVVEARKDLERAGLRGWAHHDGVFRPHVSFVECAQKRPTPEALAELVRCRKWLSTKLPAEGLPLRIPAGAAVKMLLAGVAGEGGGYREVVRIE